MNKKLILILIGILIVGGAIYAFARNPENNATLPPAVKSAKGQAAEDFGTLNVYVNDYEEKEWSDGCLGLTSEGEFCTQAIVPGYRIVVEADDKEYIYRTNSDGSVVRREE